MGDPGSYHDSTLLTLRQVLHACVHALDLRRGITKIREDLSRGSEFLLTLHPDIFISGRKFELIRKVGGSAISFVCLPI